MKKVPKRFDEIVSPYNKIIFNTIPKTGGTYLKSIALSKHSFPAQHYICADLQDALNDDFKRAWIENCLSEDVIPASIREKSLIFSVVRNPFDLLVSMYTYGWPYCRPSSIFLAGMRIAQKFHTFTCDESADLTQERRRIAEFCNKFKLETKSIVNRISPLPNIFNDPYWPDVMDEKWGWPFSTFEDFIKRYCDSEITEWPGQIYQKNFLFFQMFDESGVCRSPIVLRLETIAEGLTVLGSKLGLNVNTSLKSTDWIRQSRKKKSKNDYQLFYTDELRELVEIKCERELRSFGYNFDGHDERVIIDTGNIRYSPVTDEFNLFDYDEELTLNLVRNNFVV